jgi:dTDP-4-dehydrorhamnose 3,5-epimerase
VKMTPVGIEGAWVAEFQVWNDGRGSFREWFQNPDLMALTGIVFDVQQANISTSKYGVIRGIHYSLAENGQAKWITCINGAIKDVIVDIRPGSVTFGKYVTIDLVGGDGKAVFIGKNLGHGFVSLANDSTVAYLVSTPFSPTEEFEINPLDLALGIEWGLTSEKLILSPKDLAAPSLAERANQGNLPR